MTKKVTFKSPQEFVDLQFKWLHLEREAEIERNKELLSDSECKNLSLKRASDLERKGIGLKKLNVKEWTTSAFGKHLLSLEKKDQSDLPASQISTGKSTFYKFYDLPTQKEYRVDLVKDGHILDIKFGQKFA